MSPTCFDKIRNGDEEGVDCGGSCPPCPEGCNPPCQSGYDCIDNKCLIPLCNFKLTADWNIYDFPYELYHSLTPGTVVKINDFIQMEYGYVVIKQGNYVLWKSPCGEEFHQF